jgi:hypothetical protein
VQDELNDAQRSEASALDGRWLLVRRPLLLMFVLGCGVSLIASGRLSPRLILDGAISFAFVPVVEAAAFAVAYRLGSRRLPFARAMDLFFATNAPWLLMLVALAALTVFQPQRQVATWSAPPRRWILAAAVVLTIAWSAYLDFAFSRRTLRRSAAAAARDVIVLRGIAWTLGAIYFLGFAAWPLVVAWRRG